ncbi:MAG: hypothetical protein IKN37_01230 [Bacteroidales bacterium]|nr:hypothetical protein [Bacteroidales bacterium]
MKKKHETTSEYEKDTEFSGVLRHHVYVADGSRAEPGAGSLAGKSLSPEI